MHFLNYYINYVEQLQERDVRTVYKSKHFLQFQSFKTPPEKKPKVLILLV